jgi:hypothetical protein
MNGAAVPGRLPTLVLCDSMASHPLTNLPRCQDVKVTMQLFRLPTESIEDLDLTPAPTVQRARFPRERSHGAWVCGNCRTVTVDPAITCRVCHTSKLFQVPALATHTPLPLSEPVTFSSREGAARLPSFSVRSSLAEYLDNRHPTPTG